jgi:DNA replication protein DnaC
LTTIEETLTKMDELRLTAMAAAARELMRAPPDRQLNFEEKLGIIVDREWTARDNRRTARRIKDAKLNTHASLEEVICDPERGIAKATLRQYATCRWVREHHNVIVIGKTGVGKSYFGSALADAACRAGHRALFTRVPRLLDELTLARAAGSSASLLGKLARIDVLVLDDFLLNPMTDEQRRDLLEVFEDRYDRSSTVITTQLATKTWHAAIGDPTIADALCDRVVHNAHVVPLGGPSIRLKKAISKEQPRQS